MQAASYKKPYWVCGAHCGNKQIREDILLEIIENDEATIYPDYIITNGAKKPWQNKSRAESWTAEMKEVARNATKKRHSNTANKA